MKKGLRAQHAGHRSALASRAKAKADGGVRGKISQEVYDKVEKLLAEKKVKKAEAFREVARESGRNPAAVANLYYYIAHRRGGRKAKGRKAAAGKPGRPPGRPAATVQPKRGTVAQSIYAEVQRLVAERRIPKSQAFEIIAKQRGRSKGTVATTYYLVNRKTSQRAAGSVAPRPVGRPRREGSSIDAILAQLAAAIRQQQAEINRLRDENARFLRARELLVGK